MDSVYDRTFCTPEIVQERKDATGGFSTDMTRRNKRAWSCSGSDEWIPVMADTKGYQNGMRGDGWTICTFSARTTEHHAGGQGSSTTWRLRLAERPLLVYRCSNARRSCSCADTQQRTLLTYTVYGWKCAEVVQRSTSAQYGENSKTCPTAVARDLTGLTFEQCIVPCSIAAGRMSFWNRRIRPPMLPLVTAHAACQAAESYKYTVK
eukprot:scpid68996/ scgid20761/ 